MRYLKMSDTGQACKTKIASCVIVHRDPNITMNLFYEIIDSHVSLKANVELSHEHNYFEEHGYSIPAKNLVNDNFFKKCIYEFSKLILNEDIKFFSGLNGKYRFPVNEVNNFLKELEGQNTPESPILRIGKGQGFLSLTLAALIRKIDRENNSNIYGKLLGVVQSEKNHPHFYPVTRRLIIDSEGKYKLPGWIKLTFEPVN